MSSEEWTSFLREGTRTLKLAYLLPGGRPTVSPVWFVLEDDGVVRTQTGVESPKRRAIEADPRVSLLVDLEEPPYAFVRIAATASIVTDPEVVRRVAHATGERYMGPDRAEEFGRRNGGDDEVVIEFSPTRITAMGGVAD